MMVEKTDTNEEMTVEETPLDMTRDETPAEETPAEETPVEETPVEEIPTEEIPTEEIPIEEIPTEETPVEETPAEETPVEEIPTEEIPTDVGDGGDDDPTGGDDSDTADATAPPQNPYDLPGDWYVIHSYSGYENKVKANMETRVRSLHLEDQIYDVHIPMEDVVEFKGGKKVTVPKKVFPGYLLVRMRLDDNSWYAVRNTPGVTGFVGNNNQKPTPLSRREVERFLGVEKEEEKGAPRFKPAWEVGEQVRVVTGPFADFNGIIEDINLDQSKVVVLVNIFGRDTPVELGFDDIQKN